MTLADITARKRQEEALRASARDLERFAHLATHDMQEPLRKIITHVGFLREAIAEGDAAESMRCLDVLKRAARRGRDIVTDLLRYSKLKNKPVERAPVRLDGVIGTILDDLCDPRIEDAFSVTNRLPPLTVSCDGGIVRQVFENLIQNAIKYRKPGTIANVAIYGFQSTVMGRYVINIADDGIGFDLVHKDRIFEPFQRLVSQSQYQGTGIGLSLVRSVIEKHGWSIDVDSEAGVGTTFAIAIPLSDFVKAEDSSMAPLDDTLAA